MVEIKEQPKPLKDEPVFKTTAMVAKQTNPRTFTFVFSTDTPDRDRDVIDQDGIDIAAFRKNPVVLWAHDKRTPPVARAKSVFWRRGALTGAIEFPSSGTSDLADQLHDLVAAGFLNAVSIGFLPTEWSYDEDRGGYNFLKTELVEVSLVPVGSNREALGDAKSKGIETKALEEWAHMVLDKPEPTPEAMAEALADAAQAAEDIQVPIVKKEPESTEAEPTGQDDVIEPQQEPVEKTSDPVIEKPPRPTMEETTEAVQAATREGIAEEIKRFTNYWSGRLD